MFDKLVIERFRGIRYASIDGFKQINLFFGKNNCGKSTLLESLFLVSGLSNPLLPLHVNMVRGYGKYRLEDLQFDFYNLDSSKPIHIRVTNKEIRDLNIRLYEQNQDTVSLNTKNANILSNIDEGKYGLKLEFQIDNKPFSSSLRFDSSKSNNISRVTPKNYNESLRCVYLNAKFDFSGSIGGLQNIIKNKDEHFIVEGLQILEPRVKDFTFTDNEMYVDIGLNKRIPVNMMGDGARKIVALLTTLYDCKDGALLIDEISNGFHYSVMSNMWKVIIHAAIKNNTQLFVTTHDIDSIKGLRNAALDKYSEIVVAFKLLKTSDDELKALDYSLDSIDYSIKQEIEIR